MLVGMFKNSSFIIQDHTETLLAQEIDVMWFWLKWQSMIILLKKLKILFKKRNWILNYSPESHREGIATYFREYLRGL